MEQSRQQEQIKAIKHQFMMYRNGITADTLRKAGWPQKVIFGLNLPQLTEIARTLPSPDLALAELLWHDKEVRESRLLAPFLLPRDLDIARVKEICADLRTREEADLLSFRWLRYHKDASQLVEQFSSSSNRLLQYLAEAISRFL